MKVKRDLVIPVLSTILVLFSCGKKKREQVYSPNETGLYTNDAAQKPNETDFYNFKHYLDSEYAFDVKITNVRTVEHKGAFEIEKEKYGKPEKINGTSVTIEFNMKNPYSRVMRIPFPEYYQITSNEFEGLEGYGYHRKLDTYGGFTSIIESNKGIPLNSIGQYNDDSVSRRLIVDFEPNETKSFVVKFIDPFPSTIEKITFVGFNKYLQKQENSTLYGSKSTQYGLVIDLKSRKIIDLISLKL